MQLNGCRGETRRQLAREASVLDRRLRDGGRDIHFRALRRGFPAELAYAEGRGRQNRVPGAGSVRRSPTAGAPAPGAFGHGRGARRFREARRHAAPCAWHAQRDADSGRLRSSHRELLQSHARRHESVHRASRPAHPRHRHLRHDARRRRDRHRDRRDAAPGRPMAFCRQYFLVHAADLDDHCGAGLSGACGASAPADDAHHPQHGVLPRKPGRYRAHYRAIRAQRRDRRRGKGACDAANAAYGLPPGEGAARQCRPRRLQDQPRPAQYASRAPNWCRTGSQALPIPRCSVSCRG